jgi:hypothetical protein
MPGLQHTFLFAGIDWDVSSNPTKFGFHVGSYFFSNKPVINQPQEAEELNSRSQKFLNKKNAKNVYFINKQKKNNEKC